MRHDRTFVLASAVLAISGLAHAQAYQCKKTETQAECHDRLKCKADEEVEDCQKRLRAAAGGNNGGGNSHANDGGGSRGGDNGSSRGGDSGGGSRGGDSGGGSHGDNGGGDNGGGGGGGGGDNGGGRDDSGGSTYRSNSGGGGHSYAGHKKFGLGLELGEPDGLNGKVFVAPSGAIDFGLGYIYDHYYYGDGLHIYADYLWHPAVLTDTPSFALPFYVGVGARFWDFHYCVGNVCDYNGSAFGIRVPFGLAFDFKNTPIDIFVQLIPVLDLLSGDYYMRYGDRAHFGIDGSLGIRFWVK
jgi:hypothetical protein